MTILALTNELEMEEAFGPQWRAIVELALRVASCSKNEKQELGAAGMSARGATQEWREAWSAVVKARQESSRKSPLNTLWATAGPTGGVLSSSPGAGSAVRAIGSALVVQDLISLDGFTQEHYDRLVYPWIQTMGPINNLQEMT